MARKTILGWVLTDGLLAVLAVILATLNRSTLIIYFGVAGAGALTVALWAVLGVLAVGLNLFWLRRALKSRKRPAKALDVASFTSNGRIETDALRAELEKYRRERPALEEPLQQAVAQMNSMDRKQEKLKELFERNQVVSLGDVDATLDDTEQAMCGNIAKIVNRAILWDPLEWDKPEKREIYAEHRAYIQQMLAQNDQVLLMCDRLLSETVQYVDEKSTRPDSGQMHLEVMTETVQTLRKLNSHEDFSL